MLTRCYRKLTFSKNQLPSLTTKNIFENKLCTITVNQLDVTVYIKYQISEVQLMTIKKAVSKHSNKQSRSVVLDIPSSKYQHII